MIKLQFLCEKCGNPSITSDANAQWDFSKQCWVLSGVNDGSTCENCGAADSSVCHKFEVEE